MERYLVSVPDKYKSEDEWADKQSGGNLIETNSSTVDNKDNSKSRWEGFSDWTRIGSLVGS